MSDAAHNVKDQTSDAAPSVSDADRGGADAAQTVGEYVVESIASTTNVANDEAKEEGRNAGGAIKDAIQDVGNRVRSQGR